MYGATRPEPSSDPRCACESGASGDGRVLSHTAACGGWRLECICRAPSAGLCPGLAPHSLRGSCQVAHGFRSVSSPSRLHALITDLRPESSSSGAAPWPLWLGGWSRCGGPAGLCCRVQFLRPGLSEAAFRGWVVGPVSTASQTVLGKLVTEDTRRCSVGADVCLMCVLRCSIYCRSDVNLLYK